MHVGINYLPYVLPFLALLGHGKAQPYTVGSRCTVSQGSGFCRIVNHCQSVYYELLRGKQPEKICSYVNQLPIVCCPDDNDAPTTTITLPVDPSIIANQVDVNRPARLMCALYAQSLFVMVRSPTLNGSDEQLASLPANTVQKLMVGGNKAEPMEFPYMAAIGFNMGSTIRWDCGGTLISETFVLTAAHCTFSTQWGTAWWVRVGDLNLQQMTDYAMPQDRRIVEWIRHPDYRAPVQYNDVALLRMQHSVVFTAHVRPACLDFTGNHPAGQKAVATGWGVVDWFDTTGSPDLLKVMLPIVAYPTCSSFYADYINRLPNGINDQSQICAGENGKDTCQGDSGGPLAVFSATEANMYDVIGVTSFGQLCGSVSPGVYSRVIHYVSWIESIVWPYLEEK